jgi:hypothetical protein
MVNYLRGYQQYRGNPSEARSLIWTLNIDLTSIYAIEPVGTFAADVYKELVDLLAGEVLAETDDNWIARVAIPGLLTGRNVKLFSGQVVPIIAPQNTRGIAAWNTNKLVQESLEAAREAATADHPLTPQDEQNLREAARHLLDRIYYDLRNLRKMSKERALNYAATNAFVIMVNFIKLKSDDLSLLFF